MATMEAVIARLASEHFLIPKGGDKVYKDECIYSFDTPISDDGLYVCLSTLLGVSLKYLPLHIKRTGKTVFLHLKKIVKQVEEEADDSPPEKKPTKLAIGVEGGFDVQQDQVEYEDQNSLVVTDQSGSEIYRSLLPNTELPLNVQLSLAGIIAHQGASLQEDVQAWEEKRIVSKHALNLKQIDNGVKISPSQKLRIHTVDSEGIRNMKNSMAAFSSKVFAEMLKASGDAGISLSQGWKCSLCDLTQNLWLNLTDGTILCGRKYYDGSGGNNHAIDYFHETGYPLAVKLGTITACGGDVFSYDEDDMVEDPKLTEHLKHFGIDISLLEKTDKTMTELEIEANLSLKAEWDTIQESGKKLQPLFGPRHTGMVNLGNSCYMNSVMQVLFTANEFIERYADNALTILNSFNKDPPTDFDIQMTKLANGLLSGEYSKKPENDCAESIGIRPQMFKNLIGRGHPEFSTNHQQDALEYFLHFMDVLEKNEKHNQNKLRENFVFQLEDRIQCGASNKVQYTKREEMTLGIPLSLDDASNKDDHQKFVSQCNEAENNKNKIDPNAIVRLQIPFDLCVKRYFDFESIADYYSTAIQGKTTAQKSTRFATFPEYLVLQLRKFTVGDDWSPKKLDVSVDVPDDLDLSSYRSNGIHPNEELMPEEESQEKSAIISEEPVINEEYLDQLVSMGFAREACRKALYYTKNQGVEAGMNWIFEHSQDEDFSSPLRLPSSSVKSENNAKVENNAKSENNASPENVMMIMSMGFTEKQAKKALKANQNNVEAAAEWILTHLDDLDSMDIDEPETSSAGNNTATQYKDGGGKYKLFAFISHMGTSTSCGHYVCHIKKERRWVIFNDRKVAVSENPPKDLGYLYFYKRISEQV